MASWHPVVRSSLLAALAVLSVQEFAAAAEQQVVCEVSHVNFAWGHQHAGVYIDPKGSIGEFKYGAEDSQWRPNRGQPMSQESLREKYKPGRKTIGQVCPDQMKWLGDQLNAVRYSPSSKPIQAASDSGIQSTQCWLFSSESSEGQHIMLRETGDLETRNLAESAPALANWLEAVAQDARANAHIPAGSRGCIAYPESLHQQYDETVQQSEEDRARAMKALTSAGGLRCRMGDGHWAAITGTTFEQRPTPETYELNYFQLDIERGDGRAFGIGDEVHEVRARVTTTGVVLEDFPMDGQEARTTTVVPYRIGNQNRFPAVVHGVMADSSGLISTTYFGSCIAIPRT